MFSRGRIPLALVLVLFAWGMVNLFQARFGIGDLYPIGSSYRSDALGVRAIHDAMSEALPKTVTRLRGRRPQLQNIGDATIFVQNLSFARLVTRNDPLVADLTAAARRGARIVVTLNDREGMTCRKLYCNEDQKTKCHGRRPPEDPIDSHKPPANSKVKQPNGTVPQKQNKGADKPVSNEGTSCRDAALGLWGFEIGGTKKLPSAMAKRVADAPVQLPSRMFWHGRAKFIELANEFKVIYARGDDAVIVERSMGAGSIVLMAEGYLLSNQAQREARYPEFLLWLACNNGRIAFEESHLGVEEPRGIVSLLRELHLQGFLFGCFLVALLFAWQRLRPFGHRAEHHSARDHEPQALSDSSLGTLLRRCMTPRHALLACVEEAKAANFEPVVERAANTTLLPSPAGFNRIFCKPQERSDAE